MKNKHKRGLSRLLCTFNLGCGVTVDSIDDGVFGQDEADITIISYMLQAADDGCHVVRVLSDDTDIFVLLVYWTWRCDLQDHLAVQMEKWDGVVLDVNATCAHLGSTVCSQLLGAHTITGCDTVSYPFGKGKAPMLKTLKEGGRLSGTFRRAGRGRCISGRPHGSRGAVLRGTVWTTVR